MLNTFYSWAQDAIADLPAEVQACLTPEVETSDSAARIDFDTAARVGRITCWESGNVYAEILDIQSGQNLFDRHGSVDSVTGLSSLMRSFLEKLR